METHKNRHRVFLVAMVLLICSVLLVGQALALSTFFVATDGSDATGNGSALSPWATITHAFDILRSDPSLHDGSTVLVKPGEYIGRVQLRGVFAQGVTVRSEVPYQARLRNNTEKVVECFRAQGVTFEGFDVGHIEPGAATLVMQIQDLLDAEPGGAVFVSRISIRNNIFHDSFNNDRTYAQWP